MPSALVRQRPDVRASEAQLHEASAQIGVATAALYPQITLSGGVDRESLKIGKLFDTGTTGWSLAAGLVQPIFNGGALQAKKRAAVAAYDAAQAQYQSTRAQRVPQRGQHAARDRHRRRRAAPPAPTPRRWPTRRSASSSASTSWAR